MEDIIKKAHEVTNRVQQVVLGKNKQVVEVMLAFLANGHIMLEDIPGVGKTTLAMAFSKAMTLDCRRVQFTPDVMPSDLTGFHVYRREEERFVYYPGSVFCNLLLADEINRTSPKTQSALLEVMEERRVSVDGVTREVPNPFLVIATQNPTGFAGTQPLPEAQIDRFIVNMTLGYPDFENELSMAKTIGANDRLNAIEPVINGETLLQMQQEIHKIFISDVIYDYILRLVTATRSNAYLERGASPRATIAMVKMAKASAWFSGRGFVIPSDIVRQFPFVISHRITLSSEAKAEDFTKKDVIEKILSAVSEPPAGEFDK